MKRSTIWFLVVSALNTALAYAMLEDIGFYAREETGALLALPGMIVSMILSGNAHEYSPKWLIIPVNFLCDVIILLAVRRIISKVRKHA